MKWLILFNIILIAIVMIICTVAIFIYFKNIVKSYLKIHNTQNRGFTENHKLNKIDNNSKYGYWKDDTKNIHHATENLYNLVLEKRGTDNSGMILDIGCGTGDQDFYLLDKIDTKNCNITGIDI